MQIQVVTCDNTAQKMEFSTKDFFMENFIFFVHRNKAVVTDISEKFLGGFFRLYFVRSRFKS